DELEHEAVCRLEYRLVLHAQCRKIVDVEEAAVIDLVRGNAPVREPVGLILEQPMQGIEGRRVAGRAVEIAHRGLDCSPETRGACAEPCQTALVRLLVALAL